MTPEDEGLKNVVEPAQKPEQLRPELDRLHGALRDMADKGKLPFEKAKTFYELLGRLKEEVIAGLQLVHSKPSGVSSALRGHYTPVFNSIGVYDDMEPRVFMHEVGHHVYDRRPKDFLPPETKAIVETLFKSLADDEKLKVLAAQNAGWNTKPNEWFTQAFGTWMAKAPGSEHMELPRYGELKKVFESLLA
jgi:hypothetical protein